MGGERQAIKKPFHFVVSEMDELWSDTLRRLRRITWSGLGERAKVVEVKTD